MLFCFLFVFSYLFTNFSYILMKARLSALFKGEEEYQILKEQKGIELVGIKYVPMFDFFVKEYGEIAFKVFYTYFLRFDFRLT